MVKRVVVITLLSNVEILYFVLELEIISKVKIEHQLMNATVQGKTQNNNNCHNNGKPWQKRK